MELKEFMAEIQKHMGGVWEKSQKLSTEFYHLYSSGVMVQIIKNEHSKDCAFYAADQKIFPAPIPLEEITEVKKDDKGEVVRIYSKAVKHFAAVSIKL